MKTLKKVCGASLLLGCAVSFGQNAALKDTSWKKGGFATLMINQTSLVNWAAGGQNSVAATGLLNLYANYAKGKTAWDNSLDMGYGFIQYSNKNSNETFKPRKNEDKIEFNSKFGTHAKGKWFYSGLLNFRSQFAAGYNYPNDSVAISKFAAPAYITLALGLDYKPNKFFSLFISPATGRLTLVNDQKLADGGAFGVDAAVYDVNTGLKTANGKTSRPEFGAYLRAVFQKDIVKNVNLLTKLSLFDNYTDKIKKHRGNTDVNWEVLIIIKANKYLTTSLFTNLIYDHDIAVPIYGDVTLAGVTKKAVVDNGPRVQFKEVFGLGLSYKF